LWSEDDTQAALEWQSYRSSLCSGCALPIEETMQPENQTAYEAEPVQCWACAARDAEDRKAQEARNGGSWGMGAFDGLKISVQRRDEEVSRHG
jgi:nitrous oxide reductase accessory protein NosL